MTSLKSHACGAVTASSLEAYPLTLRDLAPWVLREVAIPIIQHSLEHGTVLQGQSGVGKTPLARILGTCLSAYHLAEMENFNTVPAIRSASHIDMFRSEPGSKTKPMLFDDGQTDQVHACNCT